MFQAVLAIFHQFNLVTLVRVTRSDHYEELALFETFWLLFQWFHLATLISMARSGHFEPFYSGNWHFWDLLGLLHLDFMSGILDWWIDIEKRERMLMLRLRSCFLCLATCHIHTTSLAKPIILNGTYFCTWLKTRTCLWQTCLANEKRTKRRTKSVYLLSMFRHLSRIHMNCRIH